MEIEDCGYQMEQKTCTGLDKWCKNGRFQISKLRYQIGFCLTLKGMWGGTSDLPQFKDLWALLLSLIDFAAFEFVLQRKHGAWNIVSNIALKITWNSPQTCFYCISNYWSHCTVIIFTTALVKMHPFMSWADAYKYPHLECWANRYKRIYRENCVERLFEKGSYGNEKLVLMCKRDGKFFSFHSSYPMRVSSIAVTRNPSTHLYKRERALWMTVLCDNFRRGQFITAVWEKKPWLFHPETEWLPG